MALDVNNTALLLGAFGVLDRTQPFLLNLFFPMEQTFDTAEVYFDKVQRARRLAPLVVPTVAGKAQPSRGYKTGSFTPAYVKPKHAVEPAKALKRRAGERLLGEMTPEQRFDLAILDNMLVEDDEITRREEYMAAQLLLSGSMVVSGPDFPAVTIDLARPAGNTVALTGAAAWGQTGVDPYQNISDWAATTQGASGFHPRAVVMDPKAAKQFIASSTVTKIMQSFRQTTGNIELSPLAAGGGLGKEVRHLGSTVDFDFYAYQQKYMDDSGTVQNILPDNTVIMGSPEGCQGIRTYGAIQDRKAGLKALARFPKVWDEEDPSVTFTMMQAAPLPLLGWSEATFCATVA
jgi:hypothetical protein